MWYSGDKLKGEIRVETSSAVSLGTEDWFGYMLCLLPVQIYGDLSIWPRSAFSRETSVAESISFSFLILLSVLNFILCMHLHFPYQTTNSSVSCRIIAVRLPFFTFWLFLWLYGVISSFSPCLLCRQDWFWCFSSGRWVAKQSDSTILCCPRHNQETETGTKKLQR